MTRSEKFGRFLGANPIVMWLFGYAAAGWITGHYGLRAYHGFVDGRIERSGRLLTYAETPTTFIFHLIMSTATTFTFGVVLAVMILRTIRRFRSHWARARH